MCVREIIQFSDFFSSGCWIGLDPQGSHNAVTVITDRREDNSQIIVPDIHPDSVVCHSLCDDDNSSTTCWSDSRSLGFCIIWKPSHNLQSEYSHFKPAATASTKQSIHRIIF